MGWGLVIGAVGEPVSVMVNVLALAPTPIAPATVGWPVPFPAGRAVTDGAGLPKVTLVVDLPESSTVRVMVSPLDHVLPAASVMVHPPTGTVEALDGACTTGWLVATTVPATLPTVALEALPVVKLVVTPSKVGVTATTPVAAPLSTL